MADAVVAESHVDINAGGDGAAAPAVDWGDMTTEQKRAAFEPAAPVAAEKPAEPEAKEAVSNAPATPDKTDDETPVEGDATPAVDDAAEAEPAESEGDAEWRDDATKAFAAAMGLSDEDLADFGSREELDRALRLIDRKAYEAGKAAEKAPVVEAEKPAVVEKPVEKPPVAGDPLADLAQFKLGDQFDEEAAAPINRFMEAAVGTIKDLQTRLAQFEQQSQQSSVAELRREALTSLHSLGNAELFGEPGKAPTREQAANVEKALEAHYTHARGLIATGRRAEPSPDFLKAAVHLAFGDQLTKQAKQQIVDKANRQSARRSGGPGAKHIPKAAPDNETSEQFRQRMASDPDLVASARRHGIRVS